MNKNLNRRNLLKIGAGAAASIVTLSSLSAESAELCSRILTPPQPEGPFYPVVDQIDTDSDLIFVQGSQRAAQGEVVIVEGIVRDQHCRPVQGALVEIWQACRTGRYDHPSDPNTAELDPDFQYWGKAISDANGFYRFRTIIPGAYPADTGWIRPPHIHYKISKRGYMELITQMYFSGNSLNSRDRILQRLRPEQQSEVIVDFHNVKNLPHPVGTFNIQIEKL